MKKEDLNIGDIVISPHNDFCYSIVCLVEKDCAIANVYYRANSKFKIKGMINRLSQLIIYYNNPIFVKVGPIWEYLYG